MKTTDTPLFSLGNRDLLALPKTAFLCSENIPDSAVSICHNWATGQRERGRCVITGFESKIEREVFCYLVKGVQPIIIVLAEGLRKRSDPLWTESIAQNRLLIITPFSEEVERSTPETIERRDLVTMDLADEIVFGFVSRNGNLEKLLMEFENKKQMIVL